MNFAFNVVMGAPWCLDIQNVFRIGAVPVSWLRVCLVAVQVQGLQLQLRLHRYRHFWKNVLELSLWALQTQMKGSVGVSAAIVTNLAFLKQIIGITVGVDNVFEWSYLRP